MHKPIDVLIPALNEEQSITRVLQAIPSTLIRQVIVVNNGSTDRTAELARDQGAWVVDCPEAGYGNACLTGIHALKADPPYILVFLDADYSDDPSEMPMLIEPILHQQADLVIGSRTAGALKGSLTAVQRFGNLLATTLVRWFWGFRYTDLGPFRAVSWEALERMKMQDRSFGWTIEMQIKAIADRMKVIEVPVSYRPRIGVSKISGTVSGSVKAGVKIIWTIFKYRFMGSNG